LLNIGLNPFELGASKISKLRISTPSGKNIFPKLDLGGFGLSRYVLDNAMFHLAIQSGATVHCHTKVTNIEFYEDMFFVTTTDGQKFNSKYTIGSYGKRDSLDKKLGRRFLQRHTGYMGVKYHVKIDYPIDEIGLDNFENGYCGIAKIEDEKFNICYLYKRNEKNRFRSIKELEEKILFKNPVIENIFSRAEFLFSEPEVINEISFEPKELVKNHILMCGDSAGLITPLCGNGMAMSIHASKLLSELIIRSDVKNSNTISLSQRINLEKTYTQLWNSNFSKRLFFGRMIQKMFGSSFLTNAALRIIHSLPIIEENLISSTHGKPIHMED
jgi:flavin-dependent dehydrogenase